MFSLGPFVGDLILAIWRRNTVFRNFSYSYSCFAIRLRFPGRMEPRKREMRNSGDRLLDADETSALLENLPA